MKTLKNIRSSKKRGAALVEYGLIVAGVALVAVAAISIFGHKTGSLLASTARVLPGAQAEDNKLISVGEIVKTDESGATIVTDASNTALDGAGNTVNKNLGLTAGELADDPNH